MSKKSLLRPSTPLHSGTAVTAVTAQHSTAAIMGNGNGMQCEARRGKMWRTNGQTRRSGVRRKGGREGNKNEDRSSMSLSI